MPYLASIVVVALGTVVLAAFLIRTRGAVRRIARSARNTRASLRERTGVLAARAAALRTQWERRRSAEPHGSGV